MAEKPIHKTKPKAVQPKAPKTIIGRSELVDFPEWHILGLRAKVDTGARTSALHVENLDKLDGDRVRFDVVLDHKSGKTVRHLTADVVRWSKVRSSSGHFTRRCFIRTRILLAGVEKEIEISLVSREKMVYRMLLGRQALAKDFLVDVARSGVRRKKKRVKPTPAA